METGILYIVATPIGNLGDMTYRAVETLKEVDLIVCEDTQTSRKLLEHYGISSPTMSFYQNVRSGGATKPVPKTASIVSELIGGKNVALITDAGTPGISDPGNQLVEAAVSEGVGVIPVPGASSLTTLISVAGIDMTRFVFLGFPPHKKGRETFFREAREISLGKFPAVFFESCHRILKSLKSLDGLDVIVGRELTKLFEEIRRGSAEEVVKYFEENPEKVKGEFVVIVHKQNKNATI